MEYKNLQLISRWISYQKIDASKSKDANKKALECIKEGVKGLLFSSPKNLTILLKNICLESIKIDFCNYSNSFLKELKEYLINNKIRGAIYGEEIIDSPYINNCIIVNGETTKEQIEEAYKKGKKIKKAHRRHQKFWD